MASNLPPGVTDSMIPGNRPEDREVEVILYLSVGEIDALIYYNERQQALEVNKRNEIWYIIEDIAEQLEDNELL